MTTAAEIEARLRELGTEKRRAFLARTTPSAMECLGATAPNMRALVKELSRSLKEQKPAEVLALARELIRGGTLEGRQVAYLLLESHRPTHRSLTLEEIEELGEGMDNWASVDIFATLLAGTAWQDGRVSDEVVEGWAASSDRWWRRAAIVATVSLNQKARGGTGDAPRTLRLCELVVSDQDEMVVKGLSWALRELSKREPELVAEFLETHDDELAARVKREVRNKLRTGLKSGG